MPAVRAPGRRGREAARALRGGRRLLRRVDQVRPRPGRRDRHRGQPRRDGALLGLRRRLRLLRGEGAGATGRQGRAGDVPRLRAIPSLRRRARWA